MRYPDKLKKGDTVGLICTSSCVSEERISQCVETIEKLGYKVKVADNVTTDLAGYMAGDAVVRARWVNRMF